ncbi:MAG TPA: YraN family protein [Acidobacteriota bacterium]
MGAWQQRRGWWRRGRIELGRGGEALAERYLRRLGYRMVERDVRLGRGQLDLIMRENEVLCFIEVKTRRGSGAGDPLEAIDRRKQRQLVQLARRYLQWRHLGEPPCRFDVVAVRSGESGEPVCELVRGAFWDSG